MSISLDLAVTMMIGTVLIWRIWRHTSIPETRGSITSSSTRSGCDERKPLERFGTVSGDLDVEPFPRQTDLQRFDETRLVFDDQNGWLAHAAPSPAPVVLRRRALGDFGADRRRRHDRRQPQRERAALTLRSTRPSTSPPWSAGHVSHDREPEPGSTGRPAAGPIDTVETLEDAIEVTLGDTDTLVDDDDLDHVCVVIDPDLTTPPGLAVLDRILDQVADCRHELSPVAIDHQ